MGLVLTVREGDAFYIDDDKFEITKVLSSTHCLVTFGDTVYDVTDTKMENVMEDVYLSIGSRSYGEVVGLVVEAPRERKILRGILYEELHEEIP